MKKILFIFIFALLAVSCVKDSFQNDDELVGEGMVRIKGTAMTPPLSDVSVSTRANIAHENVINNLCILIADENGFYVSRHEATNISQDSDNPLLWHFDVVLPLMSNPTLHFIANFKGQFSNDIDTNQRGKLLTEVISGLYDKRPDPNAGNYTEFVMWGFSKIQGNIDKTTRLVQPMIRNVSKIHIKASQNVINENRVIFSQLIVCNAKFAGAVAPFPFPADMSQEEIEKLDFANEPPASVEIGNYWSPEEPGAHENTMYVYPRRNRTDATVTRETALFLIVKAKFTAVNNPYPGKFTYYRIDIAEDETDPVTGKKKFYPYEIGRNRCYTIVINEVSGPGYLTMEEAIRNPSANNINVTVSRDPVNEVLDVVSNGQYKMGMSKKEITYFNEPAVKDTEWVEITRVWVESLIAPDDLTVGKIPDLSELKAVIYKNDDNLIAEDCLEFKDGEHHLHMELGGQGTARPYYKVMIKRNPCPTEGKRTALVAVRIGNLVRLVTITQSLNGELDVPNVVYLGWQSGDEVSIPIKAALGTPPFQRLTCNMRILNEQNGFISSKDHQNSFVLTNENSQVDAKLIANSTYYAQSTNMYREQSVEISAPGFNTKTVLVKQSKYLDGIYGSAIIGIYRDDDDTKVYTTSFGESEQAWSAKVTQGADFIRLGEGGSGVAESLEVGSYLSSSIGFDYRLISNNTGSDRFGKIVITYAKGNTHTLYVHQGFRDVAVNNGVRTTYWAASNVKTLSSDGTRRGFSVSPAYGGSMYKFGDLTYTPYNSVFPTWGKDYVTDIENYPVYVKSWVSASGNPRNYKAWSPCPTGYKLPTSNDYSTLAVKIAGDKAGENEFTGRAFKRVAWGRINDGDINLLRAGMLYVFEDSQGNVTNTLFLPAAGVRSQTYFGPGNDIKANGKLIYGHYTGTNHEAEYRFGNQGGCYWYTLTSTPKELNVPALNLYHDPDNNIGLEVMNASAANWHQISTSDAMPVRCVKK